MTVKHQGQRLTEVEACRPNGADPGRPTTQVPILPSNVVVNVEGIQDQTTDQSMTDGMALSFVDDQDCGFFGMPPTSRLIDNTTDNPMLKGRHRTLLSCVKYSAPWPSKAQQLVILFPRRHPTASACTKQA